MEDEFIKKERVLGKTQFSLFYPLPIAEGDGGIKK
jgi:hypothetical protein